MLSATFQKLSKTAERNVLVLVTIFFMIGGNVMIDYDKYLQNEVAPYGIISFELAGSLEKSTAILQSWKQPEIAMESAEWSLWVDYLFIISYVLLLCLMIHRTRHIVWKETTQLAYRIGTVLITMVVFAGFLDMIENFALLKLFYGDLQSHWVQIAFVAATIKFIMIILGILYVISSWLIAGIKKLT